MSTIVRVRGLPYDATEAEIMQAFPSVMHIQVLRSDNGKSKGEAYLQMKSLGDAKAAVNASKSIFIRHRFLEVFPSTEVELETYKDSPIAHSDYTIVKVKGLPYGLTEPELAQFFAANGVHVTRVDLVYYPHFRPTGEAFVELAHSMAAAQCADMTRTEFRGRALEIYPTTAIERDIYCQTMTDPLGYHVKDLHNIVWLRGFPFACTEEDIISFLQGLSILPNGCHLVHYSNGTPTGEALVEMKHLADFYCALSRHNTRVGHRYIEVFECCEEDLWMIPDRALKQAVGRLALSQQAGIECIPSCTCSRIGTPVCASPVEGIATPTTPPPSPHAKSSSSSIGYDDSIDDTISVCSMLSHSVVSVRQPMDIQNSNPTSTATTPTHRYTHNPYSLE